MHIFCEFYSDLLKILRCGRQQCLSAFHPLSGQVDILAQSEVLQPATHLLLSPLTEWNTHVTGKKYMYNNIHVLITGVFVFVIHLRGRTQKHKTRADVS